MLVGIKVIHSGSAFISGLGSSLPMRIHGTCVFHTRVDIYCYNSVPSPSQAIDAVNVVQGICNGQQKISLQLHSSSEESRYFASKLSTWLCILAKVMVSWLVWSLVVEAKLFVATSLWSKCRIAAAAAAAENCCDNLNDVKDEWHFFLFLGILFRKQRSVYFWGWGVVNDDFYAVVSTFDKPFFPSREHYILLRMYEK